MAVNASASLVLVFAREYEHQADTVARIRGPGSRKGFMAVRELLQQQELTLTATYGLAVNTETGAFCCRRISAIITPVPCGRTLGGRWDQQIAENKSRPRTERERERERAFNPISSP